MSSFWTDADERHQKIVRTFYENIEYTHPNRVTSRRMCPCLDYTNWCAFPLEGKAEYIEYTGPRIIKI